MYNKKSKAEIHPHKMVHPNIKRNNCCDKAAYFWRTCILKKTSLCKICITSLATTMPFVYMACEVKTVTRILLFSAIVDAKEAWDVPALFFVVKNCY